MTNRNRLAILLLATCTALRTTGAAAQTSPAPDAEALAALESGLMSTAAPPAFAAPPPAAVAPGDAAAGQLPQNSVAHLATIVR